MFESCGDPAAYESNIALGQFLGMMWAGVLVLALIVHMAKNPNQGIPVTVVETKTEETPAPGDEPKPYPEDDWSTVSVELRESSALIVKAIERQNRILERIESRRER